MYISRHAEKTHGQNRVKADRQKQNRKQTKRLQNNVVAILLQQII